MLTLPKRFIEFTQRYPEIAAAYSSMGEAVAEAGPLDAKTRALVKVGIAIAAGHEGGAHSNTRKALEAGCTPEELRHTALQALTTIGFPAMMKGLTWVEDVIQQNQP